MSLSRSAKSSTASVSRSEPVLLLRVGRKAKWDVAPEAIDDDRIRQAASDLLLASGEEGLSVYKVEGEADQREVAVRFAPACRDRLDHVDFVVFPAQLAIDLGLSVEKIPSEECDPGLNDRHFEIRQFNSDLTLGLAGAILASPERRVERVNQRQLPDLAAELCRTGPELRSTLRPVWAARIDPLLDSA